MSSRSVTWLSVLGTLVAGTTALAQPAVEVPVVDVDPVGISVTNEVQPQKKSYLFPAVEILAMDIVTNAGAQLAGMDWAKISPSTMYTNLTNAPVWDEDPYTINQLAHPYGGAMLFSAARSSGLGFWMSGVYAFGGSLVWEVLLENEPPSMNDQITTPIGGMFIGEAMHRFSRALLFPGYGKPNLIRRSAAAVIDPVGTINRAWWGDPWAKFAPPRLYAHFGVGVNQPTTRYLGDTGGDTQIHAEFVAEHGIAGDSAFIPRHPMDHFELRGSIAASRENIDGTLYTRGLALGSGFGGNGIRGLGGLFGAYDFSNKDRIRHSALGFGPGVTAELKVREKGYVQGTAAGYLVPWGAAGGESEQEKMRRDYHRGPGAASVLELKAGQRGFGEVRIASRGYQIMGTMVDEPANETVVTTTVGGRLHLTAHHAIGVEGTYAYRRASFTEGEDAGMVLGERTAEVRAFYAITTDEVFGR